MAQLFIRCGLCQSRQSTSTAASVSTHSHNGSLSRTNITTADNHRRSPHPPPTKVTIAGKNEIYNRDTNSWVPAPPPLPSSNVDLPLFPQHMSAAGSAMLLLPGFIWKPMVYMFVANALSLSTGGFVDNFYLDPATHEESARSGYPVCVDCPHFTATFYYTVIGVLDSVMMVVGSTIFRTYMRDWTYHSALSLSVILSFGTSLLDVVQFKRWNVGLGIPDWVFMVGKSSVQNTVGMICFMPTTILISKVCDWLCVTRGRSAVCCVVPGLKNCCVCRVHMCACAGMCMRARRCTCACVHACAVAKRPWPACCINGTPPPPRVGEGPNESAEFSEVASNQNFGCSTD